MTMESAIILFACPDACKIDSREKKARNSLYLNPSGLITLM